MIREEGGDCFLFHHVDHQLHAQPEAGNEHLPLRYRGDIRHTFRELFKFRCGCHEKQILNHLFINFNAAS